MEVIYFYDKDLKCCPVKEYLKQYLPISKDKESIIQRNQKILADIDAKIDYIRENGGRPTPPISKPLHGYSCFEILNPKDAKTVIRILYFRHQDKVVLLHAFEKPASYDTERERKRVDKQNQIGEKYLNIFKSNTKNYEKYE
jgi:phage-related protein